MKKISDLVLSKYSMVVAGTIMLAATFKLSAFAREMFITSRFGLSGITDAYFSLQQLPLAVASFMFGPFCRAFTPAYADARGAGERVDWLAGLLLYATLFGCLLTAVSLGSAPFIVRLLTHSSLKESWSTLAILSLCYWPIVQVGLFAGIATSYGRNLTSLTITGLPYLLMTVALALLYLAGKLNNLGLPLSMTAGFAITGLISAAGILWQEKPVTRTAYLLRPWKLPAFRAFAGQLSASSLENIGYSANQMLILFCMARAGTGAISANNCASRIGMLGFSLLVQPLAQLMQARLCVTQGEARKKTFQSYLLAMAAGSMLLAVTVCVFRREVVGLIYLHGKFSGAALNQVAALLPAWLAYFVVLSLNVIVGQYLFRAATGRTFTRNMLCGYGLANAIRFGTLGAGAPWVIWCSVIGDGSALAANLLASAAKREPSRAKVALPEGQVA